MKHVNLLLTLALAGILLTPAAIAQQRAISGHAAYIPGDSRTHALADGHTVNHGTSGAVLMEEDPTSPIHLMSQECSGTDLMSPDGMLMESVGTCIAVDADGDIFWISYDNAPGERTFRYVAGTGKFEGVEGGGTSEVIAVGHHGSGTIRYEGTLVMK